MSLGTAVFLVGVLFTITYLYVQTRNNWDWNKGIKRTGKFLAGLICLIIFAVCADYLNDWMESRPKMQTKYEGVVLGMSKTEVLYIQGQPNLVVNFKDGIAGEYDVYEVSQISADKTVNDFNIWFYGDDPSIKQTHVAFNTDGKVRDISCANESIVGCPAIFGLATYSSEEEMIEILGKPSSEEINPETGTKRVKYDPYGVRFTLKKGAIQTVGIYAPFTQP